MSAVPEANQANVAQLRQQLAPSLAPDQKVDMFSLRGFELANRIAKAYSTSDAVPAAYRGAIEKKDRSGSTWVDNPAALGNCIVAIEVAQAVGMSIAAVMQNSNVIEGRLSWSGKCVIAAVNASGRFTPLRFHVINKGFIKASYREKLGWNNEKRGFDFADRQVEVENLECVAWALPHGFPMPPGVYTLPQAKERGLPVIEGAPVSVKMAVEEGWYSKSGSKWQTEMKHLMLQYRAGSFFGNIHAPDVMMGMGKTSEELEDITTVDVNASGQVTGVTTEELRRPAAATPAAEVVSQKNNVETDTGKPATEGVAGAAAAAEGALNSMVDDVVTFAIVSNALNKATTELELDAARALIPKLEDATQQAELNAKAERRHTEITKPVATSRRTARTTTSME
jgi:hypothetical protein